MDRLPLNALRTFEAVASRLSFGAGAAALHVTPAAVSSQIRALEEKIGQPLFIRRGRQIALTDAGQTLLPGVQRGLTELQQAMRALGEDRESGILNVSMLASFLQKWLAPRLGEFYAQHPELDLRVNADSTPVDFTSTDFHAAIRFGRGTWDGLVSEKLLDDWIVPVCAPALLEQLGPLECVEELHRYPLLQSEDEPWDSWLATPGGEQASRGPMFGDAMSIVVAAENGIGLGLTRWSLVAGELESGRLVMPLERVTPSPFAYYFVAPSHFFEMPKVAHFRQWLAEACRTFPYPQPA